MGAIGRRWVAIAALLSVSLSLFCLVGCQSKEAQDVAKAKELINSGHQYAAAAILKPLEGNKSVPEAAELLSGMDLAEPVDMVSFSKMSDETRGEYIEYLKTFLSVEEKEDGTYYRVSGYKPECDVPVDYIGISKEQEKGGYWCMVNLSSSISLGTGQNYADELFSKNGLSGGSSLQGDTASIAVTGVDISGLWSATRNDSDGQAWQVLFSRGSSWRNPYFSVTKK